MSWFLTHLVSAFLLPPLNFILLLLAGLILLSSRPRLGRGLIGAAALLLYIFSTPYFADESTKRFETPYSEISAQKADAIVILGGGTYFKAPEYGGENTVSNATLERLRYGAYLYEKTGKPILVSGGSPLGNWDSEASQMKAILSREFHVPVKWAEGTSNNTEENASMSFEILQAAHIRTIYLVTQAWHMPRAVALFRHAGFTVIPAGTHFETRYKTDLLAFLPDAGSLGKSYILTHEIIGLFWFELKSKIHGNKDKGSA